MQLRGFPTNENKWSPEFVKMYVTASIIKFGFCRTAVSSDVDRNIALEKNLFITTILIERVRFFDF